MSLFVVIVTFNGAPWIRGALASLRNSELPCTAVVVDNASSDDTVAIVRQDFPEAVLIASTDNTGFGCGNNVGISLALERGAEYIFLLNQDAFVTPTALGQLVEFLQQQPSYALVSPLHCSPDLTALDPQTQRGYLQRYAPGYLSDACLGRAKPFYDIRGINAAAWMVRSEAFRRVGGFDPIFFMYGEDDDLIARFEHLGELSALLPSSRIVHLRARSPRAKSSVWRQLWALSERERSALLLDLKSPTGNWAGKLLRLISAGIIHPIGQFLTDHSGKQILAHLLATARVLGELRRVRHSAKICASAGAHFLNVRG